MTATEPCTLNPVPTEPCMMYLKLSVLEVSLGGSWHVEFLQGCKSKRDQESARAVAARLQHGWSTDVTDAEAASSAGSGGSDGEASDGGSEAGGVSVSSTNGDGWLRWPRADAGEGLC